MSVTDVVALLLGLVIFAVVAVVAARIMESSDDSMRWEGGVAIGFSALIVLGPLWIVQAVCTVLATLDDRGIAAGWLWAWLLLAPALGASPPAVVLARKLKMLQPKLSRPPGVNMQFLVDQAWADTTAAPDWVLCRTPPLPDSWPPAPGGQAVWFCYAERDNTPAAIEIAAPWACVVLGSGETDVAHIERLCTEVESIGLQGIYPLPPEKLRTSGASRDALVGAIHRGDPTGILAPTLHEWRALNSRIAAHPLVAIRLPPQLG
ncbi:MAG: hypothetical protein HYZ39_18685 [Mycolicibacterium cosmeticum]|nr:hypothetical protein [Mycolicibacterium cosmeticum]